MGKANKDAKRQSKKAAREEKKRREEEIARLQAAWARRHRIHLVSIPLVTAALSATAHWGFESTSTAGLVLITGIVVFFLVALSGIGRSVRPKDGGSAGAINFGN
jgi:hypothetical protein